jgi:hypothetical protein
LVLRFHACERYASFLEDLPRLVRRARALHFEGGVALPHAALRLVQSTDPAVLERLSIYVSPERAPPDLVGVLLDLAARRPLLSEFELDIFCRWGDRERTALARLCAVNRHDLRLSVYDYDDFVADPLNLAAVRQGPGGLVLNDILVRTRDLTSTLTTPMSFLVYETCAFARRCRREASMWAALPGLVALCGAGPKVRAVAPRIRAFLVPEGFTKVNPAFA